MPAFKNQKSIVLNILLLLALIAPGCASSTSPTRTPIPEPRTQVTLTGSGSGSVSALLAAVESAFEADTPGYNLNILSGTGTGGGVKGVLDGSFDIAAMARPPKEDETAKGIQYLSFGATGVTILAHPDVTATGLTQAQVKAVFLGEVTNWSQVGGQDLEIVLYVRDEDEAATGALRAAILGDAPFPTTTTGVLTSTGDMLTAVAGTPGGIGFATWTAVLASEAKVKALTLDGVSPDEAAYPVVLSLGIGYVESHKSAVQPLIDWLLSDKGKAALRNLGALVP